MFTFRINQIIPIHLDPTRNYTSLTCDGNAFFLTVPLCNQIIKYNLCNHICEYILVQRPYVNMCYDPDDNCFWAITDADSNKIFKLDICFKEIDCISIPYFNGQLFYITDLSYNTITQNLIILFNHTVALCSKKSCGGLTILHTLPNHTPITSILDLGYYYALSSIEGSCSSLSLFLYQDQLTFQECLADTYCITSMTASSMTSSCTDSFPVLYLLSAPCSKPISFIECQITCSDQCPPHTHLDCKTICCNLLESIALIQASIAHILNAEGEKLQKAICLSQQPCDLLKVNDSINKTLKNISSLESTLLAKLQLILDICPELCKSCDPCKPCDPCDPCDPCTPKDCYNPCFFPHIYDAFDL